MSSSDDPTVRTATVPFVADRLTPGGWRSRLTGTSAPAYAVAALLVLVVLVELLTEPNFSSSSNITNLLRTGAVPMLLCVGMTMVILTGGIDLSMGGILSVCGIAYAKLVMSGVPSEVALLVTVLLGAAIGFLVNGVLIGRVGLSFFVVTLASASLLSGFALLWSGNRQYDLSWDSLARTLGNDALAGVLPYGALLAVLAVVVAGVVLTYTVFGRSVYAIGGNPEAAQLSGVRSEWVVPAVYGVSGACAGLAGVMMIGRQTIADPTAGNNTIVLYVVAATLLAGVSITGGSGSVYAALIGTAFLQVLANALALRGFNNSWQMVVTGAILLVAVYLDRVRQRLLARRA
ncbi:ABC transporter permease [Nocardioides sp. LHD-245]|uniref:ABC transporter permease n=1 Tax=Nocardioides sp. LHD-245 TaxID=3051387 RepID=UPI0027E08392|nr:ABC transporter permease [Nocardioides sp. LHD-245]